VTAFAPAGPVTNARAADGTGPAMPALDFTWDGAATPTLAVTEHSDGTTCYKASGQALAGIAGIPESLLAAAAASGKHPRAVVPA
jgi:hypothetical protein